MKAIYSSINELDTMFPVAQALQKEYGLNPIYWSGALSMEPTLEQAFPGIVFHNFMDAIRGEWPDKIDLNLGYRKFSKSLLEHYIDVEKTFYELCKTRSDPGDGFKYYELTNYYHRALAGALSLIETQAPDVWISTSPPHSMYDNVMYEVCRRNGIKTIILFDTNLPGYLFTATDINHQIDAFKAEVSRLIDQNEDTSEATLPDPVRNYVQGIRKDYDHGKPFHFQINYPGDSGLSRHSHQRIESELKDKQSLQTRALVKHILRHGFARIPFRGAQYIKQADLPWVESHSDQLSWLKHRRKIVKSATTTFNSYKSLCTHFDPHKPYVYFPLHMQPECTTVPQGGKFADQLMTIRMLRSALAEDHFIYVKETPGQFRWHRGSLARYAWIYQEMAKIKNVCLLPTDTDPFALIDHSLCVVSITGTSGWESLVREKPVIAMGELYFYKGFEGVYQAESADDIHHALKLIQAQPSVNWNITLRDIHALINICRICTPQKKYVSLHNIPMEQNTKNLVASIADHFTES